jgi:hypothetical protein
MNLRGSHRTFAFANVLEVSLHKNNIVSKRMKEHTIKKIENIISRKKDVIC